MKYFYIAYRGVNLNGKTIFGSACVKDDNLLTIKDYEAATKKEENLEIVVVTTFSEISKKAYDLR
jgi:hypothetical protein